MLAMASPWWNAESTLLNPTMLCSVDSVALAPVSLCDVGGLSNISSPVSTCCELVVDGRDSACYPALGESCCFLASRDLAGYALVDNGASFGVAGREWLESLRSHLSHRGFCKPFGVPPTFFSTLDFGPWTLRH